MSGRTVDIVIKNQTGTEQQYAVFAQKPKVSGGQPEIYQTVIAAIRMQYDEWAMPEIISIGKYPFAVVCSSSGSPSPGTMVTTKSTKAVQLGTERSAGMTVKFGIQDSLPWLRDEPAPSGSVNAFSIQTDNSFQVEEARNKNYLIGVGFPAPSAVFTPEPGTTYQIEPQNTYYILAGNHAVGSIIDFAQVSSVACAIDGNSKYPVNIKHDNSGRVKKEW